MKEIQAWAARDEDGKLFLYLWKPIKGIEKWIMFDTFGVSFGFARLVDECFPEVKWSDEEPTKVKITIDK